MRCELIRAVLLGRRSLASACLPTMLFVGLTLLSCAMAQEQSDVLAALPAPAEAADGEVVVAYYCHVTFRCETCLIAEQLIEDLLRSDFAAALEAKRLFWRPLDYEQPENAAYAKAFGLESGPAFILGRWRAGKLVEWHEVQEIWDHSEDSSALIEIARDRLSLFLHPERWRAAMDSTRAGSGTPSDPPTAEPSPPVGPTVGGGVGTAQGKPTETPKSR